VNEVNNLFKGVSMSYRVKADEAGVFYYIRLRDDQANTTVEVPVNDIEAFLAGNSPFIGGFGPATHEAIVKAIILDWHKNLADERSDITIVYEIPQKTVDKIIMGEDDSMPF
jgi:hypothetical protein